MMTEEERASALVEAAFCEHDWKFVNEGEDFSVWRCRNCGLIDDSRAHDARQDFEALTRGEYEGRKE